jgi:hypothetical protein
MKVDASTKKQPFEKEYIKFMELHGFVNVKLCQD